MPCFWNSARQWRTLREVIPTNAEISAVFFPWLYNNKIKALRLSASEGALFASCSR